MQDDNLLVIFQTTFTKIYDLFATDLKFPEPIGLISPLEILMFFAVANILAVVVMRIGSRRDAD